MYDKIHYNKKIIIVKKKITEFWKVKKKKESWVPKNWCFWTVVLEKTLESPLDCKEIQPVHPKEDQSWVFIGRTDVETDVQYFGHLMPRVDSLEKTLMLGGIEGRRRRGWQRIASPNQWTWVWASPGVGDQQRSLACCSPWGRKELDMTEWLNWTPFITSVTKWLLIISRYRIYTHRKIVVIKHIQNHIYCPLRTIYKLFKYGGGKKNRGKNELPFQLPALKDNSSLYYKCGSTTSEIISHIPNLYTHLQGYTHTHTFIGMRNPACQCSYKVTKSTSQEVDWYIWLH